ncbi:MAG: hypothetical protein Q7S16_04700 [bacterium]|nr:hypothetical protein [bacterium]
MRRFYVLDRISVADDHHHHSVRFIFSALDRGGKTAQAVAQKQSVFQQRIIFGKPKVREKAIDLSRFLCYSILQCER